MRKIIFALLIVLWAGLALAVEPTKTATVGASWTTVCEDAFGRYGNVSLVLHNTGSQALTACQVQVYVGPDADDWATHPTGWTACASLGAGAKTTWSVSGNSFQKIRVQAQSTSGTTTLCRQNAN